MAKFDFKTTVAAAAVAVSAAAFCPGTAQAVGMFTQSGAGTLNFTIKDKDFANFSCVSANPGCGAVSYAPATPKGTLGVKINPDLAQFGPGTQDVFFEYSVSTTSGKPLINDLRISSDAAQTGTGIVSDVYKVCTTSACAVGTVLAHGILIGDSLGVTVSSAPQSVIWVSEDMNAHVGADGGLATMTSITKVVSEVTVSTPEPASLALVGVGLLGLGMVRRRKAV